MLGKNLLVIVSLMQTFSGFLNIFEIHFIIFMLQTVWRHHHGLWELTMGISAQELGVTSIFPNCLFPEMGAFSIDCVGCVPTVWVEKYPIRYSIHLSIFHCLLQRFPDICQMPFISLEGDPWGTSVKWRYIIPTEFIGFTLQAKRVWNTSRGDG